MFVIGLNENVKGSLLKEVCTEMAPVHAIKIPRHPKTKTFLGAATVCFERPGSGRLAVSELDGKIVGGCYLRAELDDDGRLDSLSSAQEAAVMHANFLPKDMQYQ